MNEVLDTPVSQTEAQLLAVYGPVVPLEQVSKVYFNLGPAEAKRRAARCELPVPTFQLVPSQKAPLLIKVADLAKHIDDTHETSLRAWQKVRE